MCLSKAAAQQKSVTCLKLSCACTLKITGTIPADTCVPSCCSKLLSLCCITEGTKLLLDFDTCLHEKMLGYKLRAFSEMLQYRTGKVHCHISLIFYETLVFPSLNRCGFDFYEKNIRYLRKVKQY